MNLNNRYIPQVPGKGSEIKRISISGIFLVSLSASSTLLFVNENHQNYSNVNNLLTTESETQVREMYKGEPGDSPRWTFKNKLSIPGRELAYLVNKLK